VTIVGGVFSQAEGFTSLSDLWPGLVFHAVATALGIGLLGKGIGPRQAALAGASSEKR
jgi:hypothetical protein